jgi:transcription-repair coupling factor (superfamily II helicase)
MFDQLVDAIHQCIEHFHGTVVILGHYEDQLNRLANLLENRGIKSRAESRIYSRLLAGDLTPACTYVGIGEIASYQWYADINTLIIPERLFFGTSVRKPRKTSAKLRNLISSFRDLKVGDLIVHVTHGIGRYRGMESLAVGGTPSDFLLLEYAGGDRLYLPVDKLNLLQKYQSADHSTSAIDRLNSQAWEKRKSGVRKAVKDMAEKLLRIQAERKLKGGFRYSAPGEDYFKFEAEFPYEETEDQLRAIADVNHDLSMGNSMDRLICGDVGFGKTEVALRAAFRVVLDHRQVMVLVPTTVLCYQHYRTFHGRLSHLGARVAQINRFVSPNEAKEILAQFARGEIDVLIGTHRLLSKDIKPKLLGLLVVDEEQRFGVSHKEKLKEIRANCDVLTLTATPIPRTLHMAVLGLRDISIITTPPTDRRFVKTYLARFDEHLIRNAIEFEMQRSGQVFFVHNKVEDIQEIAKFIKTLVPSARIAVGHGQMAENTLEEVIVDFLEHRYDVLVCTTIIESGIDMPNVNTLIANDADRFGLAQLYQLRGRVGRSDRQAYAYFLSKDPDRLSDDARKRLEVLLAHQELGSGFQIASHDLELRGAGNLLGGEQSGKIAEVGLELYTQMLDAAINEIRTGKQSSELSDIEIKLPFALAIPDSYIPDESNRLQTYKALFSANDVDEIDAIRREINDRYGKIPDALQSLTKVAELKYHLRVIGAQSFSLRKDSVAEIRFGSIPQETIKAIMDAASAQPRRLNLGQDFRLQVHLAEERVRNNPKPHLLLDGIIALLLPISLAVNRGVH